LFSGQINRCSRLDISSGKKFYNFVPEKRRKKESKKLFEETFLIFFILLSLYHSLPTMKKLRLNVDPGAMTFSRMTLDRMTASRMTLIRAVHKSTFYRVLFL
jgi:hypothetical protein